MWTTLRRPPRPASSRTATFPSGYTPFNVQAIGSSVDVAYARPENGGAESSGGNRGVADAFTNFAMNVSRIATDGNLNGPSGLANAPSSFGAVAGDLLVGDFKGGFVNVFQGSTFVGRLGDSSGRAIQIQELWTMIPGNAASRGADALWFSAGPAVAGTAWSGSWLPPRRTEVHGGWSGDARCRVTRPTIRQPAWAVWCSRAGAGTPSSRPRRGPARV